MNKRALGLDFGAKTTGVAVSDLFGWTSNPLETVYRKNEDDISSTLERLRQIAAEYDIGTIAVGYPKNMNNTEGPRCAKTLEFVEELKKTLPNIPVVLEDERLTTKMADRLMLDADLSRKKRDAKIDSLAACLILDSFLAAESKKNYKGVAEIMKNKDNNENVNEDFFDEDFDDEFDDAYDVVTVENENGENEEYYIIDELTEKGTTYVLLAAAKNFEDDEESEAIIFKRGKDKDGNDSFEDIESDEEITRISKLFAEINDDFTIE